MCLISGFSGERGLRGKVFINNIYFINIILSEIFSNKSIYTFNKSYRINTNTIL